MTRSYLENYRTTQAKALANLCEDIKQAPSFEELVDALEYIIGEAEDMLEDAKAHFEEEQIGD